TARGDELLDEPRRVRAARALEQAHALVRLDLDPARAGELGGRPRGGDAPVEEDDDAIAHELDLAQQVRVEEHRDALRAQLLEKLPHGAAPDRVERARRLVE